MIGPEIKKPEVGIMARVALFPIEMLQSFLKDKRSDVQKLQSLAKHQPFLEALTIASPTLAEELLAVNETFSERRLNSLLMGVTRYLVRATTRCTPFGTFSGVCAVQLAENAQFTLHDDKCHQKTLRVDAQEVWKQVKLLEQTDALLDQLYVYANPTRHHQGERLQLPYQDTYGQGRNSMQVSVRSTPVVQQVLQLTQRPIQMKQLLIQLQKHHPDVALEHIRPFVVKLLDQQLLLSTLRPPMTAADPLAYLATQTPSDPIIQEHHRLQTQCLEWTQIYNNTRLGEGVETLQHLLTTLGFQTGQSQKQVQVDTRASATACFAHEDLQHLKKSIIQMTQWFPRPTNPALTSFITDFLERYGHREVPLLELLDPEHGLGGPAGYSNPMSNRSIRANTPEPTDNMQVIAQVLQHAGPSNLPVDLEDILPTGAPLISTQLPTSVDVFVRRVPQDQGPALLVLEGLHAPGGSTFGRFTHIEPELYRHLKNVAALEEAQENLLVVDLVYSEGSGHANNVAIHAPIYQHQTAVACTPGVDFECHVALHDVMVGVRGDRFYFRSQSRNVQLLFRTPHVLNVALAPNAVRFLKEVSDSYSTEVPYWSWGKASHFTRLPRVTCGPVVLAPARWFLPPEIVQSEDFHSALQEHRTIHQIPRFVYAGNGDNRLLLDLDDSLSRTLLYNITSKETPVLEEALDGYEAFEASSPLGHHAVQYVVAFPLGEARLPVIPSNTHERPDEKIRWVLPFEGGLYLKLYGPASLQDDVICAFENMTQILQKDLGPNALPDGSWFFIRYADPDQHIRWRLLGEGTAFETISRHLLQEAALLHSRGLLTRVEIASYERELERYGGNQGIGLCEKVFGADSQWIATLLSDGLPQGEERLPIIAATADALLDALHVDHSIRHWALEHACAGYQQEFGAKHPEQLERMLSQDFRKHRHAVWSALTHVYPRTGSSGFTGLHGLRTQLHPIAATFQNMVDPQKNADQAALILTSILHMHANRAQLDRLMEFRALHLLLKTHRGFVHHFPSTIDPVAFQSPWKAHFSKGVSV